MLSSSSTCALGATFGARRADSSRRSWPMTEGFLAVGADAPAPVALGATGPREPTTCLKIEAIGFMVHSPHSRPLQEHAHAEVMAAGKPKISYGAVNVELISRQDD